MKEGKSFQISKHLILEVFKRVKANKGAGGIDGIDIETYEEHLKDNLYKLWNRMSSGSYFPKPVRGVEIPKKDGKKRLLGIPTIEDRISTMHTLAGMILSSFLTSVDISKILELQVLQNFSSSEREYSILSTSKSSKDCLLTPLFLFLS